MRWISSTPSLSAERRESPVEAFRYTNRRLTLFARSHRPATPTGHHPLSLPRPIPDRPPDRASRIALLFALSAEQLTAYYEHGQWLSEAQGAARIADWLARSRRRQPLTERHQLAAIGRQLADEIAGSLSREAGLHAAHEMMEALDPNYHSELAETLMIECERRLDAAHDANERPGHEHL